MPHSMLEPGSPQRLEDLTPELSGRVWNAFWESLLLSWSSSLSSSTSLLNGLIYVVGNLLWKIFNGFPSYFFVPCAVFGAWEKTIMSLIFIRSRQPGCLSPFPPSQSTICNGFSVFCYIFCFLQHKLDVSKRGHYNHSSFGNIGDRVASNIQTKAFFRFGFVVGKLDCIINCNYLVFSWQLQ